MLKAVVAATAAVTIAGSTMAYAQRNERADGAHRWQPTTEDMRAFQAARLAALRAGLSLSPEQEKYWPAFEQAMRDLQQVRLDRIAAKHNARHDDRPRAIDPAERMRERANRFSENGAVLKRLADATEPLYSSLDDAQKRRFAILSRAHGRRGLLRPGREGGDRMPRGHRRTDASPDDATQTFTRKTVDGDVFAQTFVSKTIDGVLVGRVFGTKTLNGDLAVGEAALFSGKTLEPVAFGSTFTAIEPGLFSAKVSTTEPATFSRKIMIGEPAAFGSKALTKI
jgi:hypothetical protein